jgi:hypothetical protein
MGLDVNLYHSTDLAAAKAAADEYEKMSEAEWGKAGKKYEEYTQKEKDAIHATNRATAERLGLTGEYESHHSVTSIKEPSAKYPDHYFKIGYFRSSYNDGGINSVMHALGLPDLYDIIPATDNLKEYEFVPDWAAVKSRCADALSSLKEKMGDPISEFFAFHVRGTSLRPQDMAEAPLKSEEAVLSYFNQELQRWAKEPKNDFIGGDYSSAHGYYSRDGLTVHAILSGSDFLSPAGVWVVAKAGKEGGKAGEHRLAWYFQALEIVEETCDFVLSKPDPQNYYLGWSA